MPSQAQITLFCTAPNQFMRANSVRWRGFSPEDAQIIEVVLLDAAGQARIRTGSKFLGMGNAKASVPKFELRWANNPHNVIAPNPDRFSVQWSGYKAKQARGITLPAVGGPDLMLTPELTGCTVACRSNPDGSADFIHYNLRDPVRDGDTLDDTGMTAVAQTDLGVGSSILTKGDYRAVGKHTQSVSVTVVGIRAHGAWTFWAQYREDKASGEQIRAVRQL